MTFSTLASPGVSLQGGGGSGGGGGGTPGGSNTQIQYNSSGTFAGASGLTTTTGTELTIASGTKTADAPVLNMSQTWNNAAVTFTGLRFNATDTASNAASLLMDLQVGGVSRFSIGKDGSFLSAGSGWQKSGNELGYKSPFASGLITFFDNNGLRLRSAASLGWNAGTTASDALDLILTRRDAANLRLGAADAASGVQAQTLSVQSITGTNASAAAYPFKITGAQGTGNAAGGSIIFQVAPAGGAGPAQNTLVDALTIDSTKLATFAGNVTVSGGTAIILPSALRLTGFSGSAYLDSGDSLFHFRNYTTFTEAVLAVDAANTLALRNGANAQTFNVYKTFDGTVGGNNSYFTITANTGTGGIDIGPAKSGTGANLSLFIGASNPTGGIYLRANGYGNTGWYFSGSGSGQALLCETDNAYDIGASGGSRPRNVYVAGAVAAGGLVSTNSDFRAGSANFFYWNSRSQMSSPADGLILLQNIAASDFGRLQFGGTTSSFPALKRNSTALETKLADDSAYAPHAMQYLDVTDGITAPASATGRARIYVDTADGDLKVIFADGTVKTIVTDT